MTELFAYITWGGSDGIDLGFFTLHYYSLMWILAFIIGWFTMGKIFKIDKVDKELMDPLFLYTFLGTIIGARLGEYLFYDTSMLWTHPEEVFLPIRRSEGDSLLGIVDGYKFVGFQGLASHGATLGILISSYLFKRKYLPHKPYLWLLDRMALVVPIGAAFIRLGNFLNSEIVGKASQRPWAVKFLNQSSGYGDIVPRHPAQLYEALGYFTLFFILWGVYRKTDKKYYPGYIIGLFFVLLFSIRFIVEFFKEDQGKEAVAEWLYQNLHINLNNGQVLSIPFIILGGLLMYFAMKRPRLEQ